MELEPLSPELERIERDLMCRSQPAIPAGLRERALGRLPVVLGRERLGESWNFAVAVAVSVLIWINVSMISVQTTDFFKRPIPEKQEVLRDAEQFRLLLPDLSETEAYRQALLLHAGNSIIPRSEVPQGIKAHDSLFQKTFSIED